ncbi:MAG: hypothetical protein WB408_18465, partial [Terracidiphilus sp.]
VAAKINTPTTSYYQYPVYDQPGNVRRILNAAGAVTGSFEYNAWGERLLNQPPTEGTRFSFSAPAWVTLNDDPDGVVVVTPTRWRHVGIGRFGQRDPIQRTGTENPYGADIGPLEVDPDGLTEGYYNAASTNRPWMPGSSDEYRQQKRAEAEAEQGCTDKNSKKPNPADCKEGESVRLISKTETYIKTIAIFGITPQSPIPEPSLPGKAPSSSGSGTILNPGWQLVKVSCGYACVCPTGRLKVSKTESEPQQVDAHVDPATSSYIEHWRKTVTYKYTN